MASMLDWNVVVTVRGRSFNHAINVLRRYGEVRKTGLYNVVVLSVPDVRQFLEEVRERSSAAGLFELVSHIFPVTLGFHFASPEDFEQQACTVAAQWAPQLVCKSFHVRMHRRGLRGQLHSTREEQLLDRAVLSSLAQRGAASRIEWADPDAILSIETIRNEAGMALWTREDFARYPFLLTSLKPRSARAQAELPTS
jgi:tRNA(Ser,Leu) C12 N-acetylase TAN1